jgi:hypothetical protein
VEKKISVGTDVAHLILFHPDDLSHRNHDPIAWYGYDFAYRRESAAGRLVAWGTGADGGYLVRLTTGSLTTDEQVRACVSWSYPLVVRHGRVLLDNTDALPGEEQMVEPEELVDTWFDLPNGSYLTTVHPVDRTDEDATALPDYVVTFEPVETIAGIEVANTPPELRPFSKWTPRHPESMETEKRFLWPDTQLEGDAFAALVVPQDLSILPTSSASFPVSEEVADAIFPDTPDERISELVLAATLQPGSLAMVTRVSGRSWQKGRGAALSVSGLAVARILETSAGPIMPRVRVAPLDKPDMAVDESILAEFRRQLASTARRSADAPLGAGPLTISGFEIERMETLSSAEGLTGWALMHLAMPLDVRLSLWASSTPDRMEGIEKLVLE